MMECNICLTKTNKRSKNKHEQSKKHKYFSNLNMNRYFLKNDEMNILKDVLQSYYDDHKKKL